MNRRTTVLIMGVALVSAGCWLQPGNDAERSGFAPLESNITTANVDQLHFDWSKQFAAPAAAPAVAVDALYVNAGSSPNAGTLYRLAPTDGATQWSKELFAAGTPFYTPQQPTVTGDVVYVAETGFSILPSSIMRFNAVAGTPLPLIAAGGHDLTQRASLLVSTLATGNSSMIAVSKVFVTDTQGSGSWNTIITVGSLGSVPTPTSAAATTSRFFIGNGAEILVPPLQWSPGAEVEDRTAKRRFRLPKTGLPALEGTPVASPPFPRGNRLAHPRGIATLHDHDHRLDFAGGDQVIQNEVGMTLPRPAGFIFSAPVLQIEHRIPKLLIGIVTRWSIDQQMPCFPRHLGVVPERTHLPVRHVLDVMEIDAGLRDFDAARRFAGA